jgi:hypothetical protein
MESLSEDKKNEIINTTIIKSNSISKMEISKEEPFFNEQSQNIPAIKKSFSKEKSFFNGQSQNIPAIKKSFSKEKSFFNGPMNPKHEPCLPIHFKPPREIPIERKPISWFPTIKSISTSCYKQTADCIDKQPPKPLPKYTKINIYKNPNIKN